MAWLKHTYATQLPETLYSEQAPESINQPSMALYNSSLATDLGIEAHFQDEHKTLGYLSGNEAIPGSQMIAQAYAGHQFGHFNRLGDGRAVLLGELETTQGLFDLQLKGSGRTPYSRGGDGRATFYSMLREYLISEAMHALGIPTTRSLAVVKTTDPVFRDRMHEGGVLTRMASSHIRVGTFEFARYLGEAGDLKALLEYTIQRHYPDLRAAENQALALLQRVMEQQQTLILHWLRVGFIHGVMNTDNMSIAGETIDYGPCAFMNAYHANTVFSSIDRQGRYAFANQPNMAYWNLNAFANALLPFIDEDKAVAKEKAEAVLAEFPKSFSTAYFEMMGQKLGIVKPSREDQDLFKGCTDLLTTLKVDYTNFFTELRRGGALIEQLQQEEAFEVWYGKWDAARLRDASLQESEALMAQTNPVIIPRNHIVESVLDAAVAGDLAPFHQLLDQLASPYTDACALQEVPAGFDAAYQTFCGT